MTNSSLGPDERYRDPAIAALSAFGIQSPELTLVSVSENVTFRATAPDGERFVVRLHRPGYHSLAELDSERLWLAALSDHGVSVPQPIPATDGTFYVPVKVSATATAAGEVRYLGVSRWRDGDVVANLGGDLQSAPPIAGSMAQLGRLMATMHDQAVNWHAPPGFTRHRLDADGLLGDKPFWGPFWEHPDLTAGQQALLLATRLKLRDALVRYGTGPSTFSMIHADFHLGNLLLDHGDISVIDFDDAGFGWHQYDIGVAMFHSRGAPDSEAAERAFFEAYRAVRPLSDADRALVPMFELIRGMAIIGWKAQRPEVVWPAEFFNQIVEATLAGCEIIEPPC